jgi:H/ACA ribonucleoprotein complex subunit 3
MAQHIFYCKDCKKYTMEKNCPLCKKETFENKPPKYSPEDKYAKFRREVKGKEYKSKGLI